MRKLILYIASSMNGYIADTDGGVEWLETVPNPEKSDYGYNEFYRAIDTTIMGYNTFQQIVDWDIDFPYAGKKNYVFTRKTELPHSDHVEFISEQHLDFVRKLKQKPGGNIWLIGGGQINTLLLNADLIDELLLFVMPIILPDGKQLFAGCPDQKMMTLKESKKYNNGVCELNYVLT